MRIRFKYFIVGIFLGILTLLTSPKPAVAFYIPLPDLPSLEFLIPRFIRPVKPTIIRPLRPLRPGEGITILPTETPTPPPTEIPTVTATITPALTSTITPTPTPTVTSTPTPTITPTPTATPQQPTEAPTETPASTPTESIPPTQTPVPTVTPTVATGPLAYWKIESGDDNIVVDSSGHGYSLQLIGNPLPQLLDDKPPTSITDDTKSLYFDGSNLAMLEDSTANSAFDFPTGFTLEIWIKAAIFQPHEAAGLGLISKVYPGGGGLMMLMNGGQLGSYMNGDQTYNNAPIQDGNWHHAAITWDGSKRAVFVDGISNGYSDWPFTPNWIGKILLIATGFPPDNNFRGNLDEIKIYNYARTEAEIREDAGIIPPTILINEFMPKPSPSSINDWIELYNATSQEVDVSGWQLRDTATSPMATLSSGTKILPHSYILIEVGNRLNDTSDDTIYLLNNSGKIVDQRSYYIPADVSQNISIGRSPDGNTTWKYCTAPSPGSSNDSAC